VRRRHRGGSPATAPETSYLTGEDECSSSSAPPLFFVSGFSFREKGELLSLNLEREGMLKMLKKIVLSPFISTKTGPVFS